MIEKADWSVLTFMDCENLLSINNGFANFNFKDIEIN